MEIRNEEKEVEGIGIMRDNYQDGKYLVEVNLFGDKTWIYKEKIHREDGPAVEGYDYRQWWLNNKRYTEKRWKYEMRKRKLAVLGI